MNRLWNWLWKFSFILQKRTAPTSSMFLKIFFNSPEMNCSIFFSMYFLLWMTKKKRYFFRYLIIEKKENFHGSMSIKFLLISNGGLLLVKSQQVFFFVDLLLSSVGMQNLLHSVLTHILRAYLLEFMFHCCSNSSQLKWSMRKSHLKVSVVSVQIRNSDLNSMFTMQATGCNFQYKSNLCCCPWIHSFDCDASSSKEKCIRDRPLHVIVRDLQCLSSWNTVDSQQHSEILHP